jgi:hypothetical protein
MPVPKSIRAAEALDLPSVFRLITVREAGDAFTHATMKLLDKSAGTLVWARRFQLAEFAVVLEPSEPLAQARLVFFAAMNALADTLAVHCPPEKPVAFEWPDTLLLDGGVLGGGRLSWADCGEDDVPDWLVFGAMVRTAGYGDIEPGRWKRGVALAEEGIWDVQPAEIVESFARHLMSALHNWSEFGPRHEIGRWMERLQKITGTRAYLDERGNLCEAVGRAKPETRAFAQALATPSWLDPETGGPWL